MGNQYPPVIAKSLEVIKRFEEKFGWFSIRAYQFPQIRYRRYHNKNCREDLDIKTDIYQASLPGRSITECE